MAKKSIQVRDLLAIIGELYVENRTLNEALQQAAAEAADK